MSERSHAAAQAFPHMVKAMGSVKIAVQAKPATNSFTEKESLNALHAYR
jgi:hypothetical protein